MVAEGFKLNHEKVTVAAVVPPVTFVNVYRFATYLPDDVLTNALQQYGMVKSVTFATVTTRQNKLNGVRVVKIEMSKPVPKFTTIRATGSCANTEACDGCARAAGKTATWPPPAQTRPVRNAASSATTRTDVRPNVSGAAAVTGLASASAENHTSRLHAASRPPILNRLARGRRRRAFKCSSSSPPVPTSKKAPNYRDNEGIEESDDTRPVTSSPPPAAAAVESADDWGSAGTDAELTARRGPEPSSAEPSRDSWPASQTKSEEQEVPKTDGCPDSDGR
ncbi:hypothetical protein MTO96_029539 [Rhipicephalus appendiculatus]